MSLGQGSSLHKSKQNEWFATVVQFHSNICQAIQLKNLIQTTNGVSRLYVTNKDLSLKDDELFKQDAELTVSIFPPKWKASENST